MMKTIFTGLLALFAAISLYAAEPFTIKDIRVEGLGRVEPGTVFANLPFRTGDQFTDQKGSTAIKVLFDLGLFKDVRLQNRAGVLVVMIEERPQIASVDFVGTKEFEKDNLLKALKDIGLAEGQPFDKALADKAEQELKRQYIGKSLYGAEIVTTAVPLERNRVNLVFTVSEGQVAKIKSMRIVGNAAFSESTLLGLLDLDSTGFMSWYTKSDRYTRSKFNGDLESLRSYYLTRGYLEFKINSTQVALSVDKQEVDITINITEGLRYVVSGVSLQGNYLGKDDEFKALIEIPVGEAYNADKVASTTKAFTDWFGKLGYAFARVEVRADNDQTNARVQLQLVADPSRRAFVRRINITGNARTRDEVIRREFRQFESSWYDGEKIKLSRDRIDRLGYFKEVSIDTQEVPGSPDQVDLILSVAEKPTGNLTLGAGFSSAEKVTLQFSINQDNIFGTGHFMGVNINTSKYNRVATINTTDPYFTKDGVSRTFELSYSASRPYNDAGGDYRRITTAGALRFGIPISELDRIYLGVSSEQTQLEAGTNIPAAYLAYADVFGYKSRTFPLTLGWSKDGRDSALVPSNGVFQRLNGDISKWGEARYVRLSYQYQQFVPLSKKFTAAFNTELGMGKGLEQRPYPIFKSYYAGGLGSVRGFEQSSLGPRDVTGAYLGGSKKLIVNSEISTPFPGAGNDKSLRLFGFIDAGNVYGESQAFDLSTARASVGVGLSWISPIGPLRFGYANPIRQFSGDRINKLQFQVGNVF